MTGEAPHNLTFRLGLMPDGTCIKEVGPGGKILARGPRKRPAVLAAEI